MATDESAEQRLVTWLRETRRVLAFCGAGVSAESGVPTFRGAGGLWEGHRIEEVATPEAFEHDPQTVWRFYAQRQAGIQTVDPNPAHSVLSAMDEHYPEFLLVTQNVDNLHERAGSSRMLKIHGSLMEVRCTECERVTPIAEPVSLSAVERGDLPHCRCGGLLRPHIVWFGEYLNRRHLEEISGFLGGITPRDRAVVLIIGTSGAVSGGYSITALARSRGARLVEINPEASALSEEVDLVLRQPAGKLMERVWGEVKSKK